ncbi:hypothetical protein BDZ91DRAFT_779776 [Kalaharituber pfeilii]|nr:hypothetical protein BDZ91DRAFT_779776 [Kalaharituber pfeilii]
MPARTAARNRKNNIAETTPMDISEGENPSRSETMASNNPGSDDEGSGPPEGENAQTPKPANGARSVSSSTAQEESTPAAESGRRRSGRVIRKPLKLADEAPAQSTATKRKRVAAEPPSEDEEVQDASGADDESNGEEEESDSGESEEGDEPDEEELQEKKKASKKKASNKKATHTPPKAKAPAAKKARTVSGAIAITTVTKKTKQTEGLNGSTSKAPPAGRKGKGKQSARQRRVAGGGEEGDNALFDAVMDADKMDVVASDWTTKYLEDGLGAMRQLVNFFLRCCGCEHSVTQYDIEDQDSAAATLSQIQDHFSKQQSPDYPLISKRPEFRGFRKSLFDFLQALIKHIAAKELLYTDPPLIENIQIWIIAMSSSTLRPFRHTSTIISFNILTTLCDIASDLRKSIVIATRQLDAENKKSKKNQGRIKALEEKLNEGEERRDSVEVVIKDIFDAVFVHRYRDIDPKIRTDCVHDLATWILKLPDLFFDGTYLRYLGWVLSDTSALTRAEVIRSLSRIFKNKDNVSGMRNFTERFRPRLVEMATRDADSSVRAMTVELLDVVREVGFLEPADVDTVGRLLFDSDARVRKAVVGFFVKNIEDLYEEKIEELGGQEVVDEGMAGIDESDEDYSGPRISWVKLKCLVEVLASYDEGSEDGESGAESQGASGGAEKLGSIVREGAVESRFSLAGAALWERFPDVQDWEGIAKYLLYDHSAPQTEEVDDADLTMEEKIKRTCALEPKEEVILLQVLNASVAASVIASENAALPQAAKTHRKKNPIARSKEDVSRSLATLIPPLLRKFGPVPDAASTVLHLEQLMKLDVYSDLRQSAAYASLLDDINRQFLTHADESVLKEASAALLHAKTFEELDEVTGAKLGQLQEETIAVLMACVAKKDPATARFGDKNLTELINTVRRLEYLASITDCREMLESAPTATITSRKGKEVADDSTTSSNKLPIEILLSLLSRGTSLDELEEELIVRVLKVLLFYFMWKVKALSEEDLKDITDLDIDDLQERRQETVMAIGRILHSRSRHAADEEDSKVDGMDLVRLSAAGTLLDIYTLFATLRSRAAAAAGPKTGAGTSAEDLVMAEGEGLARLVGFSKEVPEDLQKDVLRVFSLAERKFAKAAKKSLEEPEEGEQDSDTEEDKHGEEENEEEGEDQATLLTYEQRLCEYTGKIVLAVLGDVVDREKFVKRVSRNRTRLGANFKEVVAHLMVAAAEEDAAVAANTKAGKRGGRTVPNPGDAQTPGPSGAPVAKQGPSRGTKGAKSRGEMSDEDGEEEEEIEDRIVVDSSQSQKENDRQGGSESDGEPELEDEVASEVEINDDHDSDGEERAGKDAEEAEDEDSIDSQPVQEDEDEEMVDA